MAVAHAEISDSKTFYYWTSDKSFNENKWFVTSVPITSMRTMMSLLISKQDIEQTLYFELNNFETQDAEAPCIFKAKVDNGPVYFGSCVTNTKRSDPGVLVMYELWNDKETINFIEELKKGYEVSFTIKLIGIKNELTFKFNLLGFSSAFKRSLNNVLNNK